MLIIFVYIKLKYRFWSIQPVYHTYDIFYWFCKKSRIIHKDFPKINRYVNIIDIQTKQPNSLSHSEKQIITKFIKKYYLQTNVFNYMPKEVNVFPYLENSNHPGFISLLHRPTYKMEKNTAKIASEYTGLITSRVLLVTLNKNPSFPTYYIDHLSIDPGYKNKETIPKLLQTHIYNTRHKNHTIQTGLLKHYKKPSIVKALTSFNIVGFDIHKCPAIPLPHARYNLIEISQAHVTFLNDFLNKQKKLYDCIIIPELTNILSLIKTQNIFMYGMICNNSLVSLHIFKNIVTYYGNHKTLEERLRENPNCILSIASLISDDHKKLLMWSFLLSLHRCSSKIKATYLFIESSSKNKAIAENIMKMNIPIFNQKTHLILYNFIHSTIDSEKCLIIY